jgi:hypothetical protein
MGIINKSGGRIGINVWFILFPRASLTCQQTDIVCQLQRDPMNFNYIQWGVVLEPIGICILLYLFFCWQFGEIPKTKNQHRHWLEYAPCYICFSVRNSVEFHRSRISWDIGSLSKQLYGSFHISLDDQLNSSPLYYVPQKAAFTVYNFWLKCMFFSFLKSTVHVPPISSSLYWSHQ